MHRNKHGARYRTKKDGSEKKLPCDCVILAAGMVSRYDVFEDLLDCSPDVIPIGDCVTPGTVMNASPTAITPPEICKPQAL
jgi:hypothetical protein